MSRNKDKLDRYVFITDVHDTQYIKRKNSFLDKNLISGDASNVFLVAIKRNVTADSEYESSVDEPSGIREVTSKNAVFVSDLDSDDLWWPKMCVFLFGEDECIVNQTHAVYFQDTDKSYSSNEKIKNLKQSLENIGVTVTDDFKEAKTCVIVQENSNRQTKDYNTIMMANKHRDLRILEYYWGSTNVNKFEKKINDCIFMTNDKFKYVLQLLLIPKPKAPDALFMSRLVEFLRLMKIFVLILIILTVYCIPKFNSQLANIHSRWRNSTVGNTGYLV